MEFRRFARRIGKGVAIAALVAAPLAAATVSISPAGAAGSVSVATPEELSTAWADTANTHITLTADIELSSGSNTCFIDEPFRDTGGTGIVVDGQGLFGITSSCSFGRLLTDWGTESVTLTGLTHFDDGFICGAGGGLYAEGPVTVENTSVADNTALGDTCPLSAGGPQAAIENDAVGGGVYSASAVTVTGSTFTGNHADLAGGGFAAPDDAMVTSSTFTNNTAGIGGSLSGSNTFSGAGFAITGAATVTDSTFDANHFGNSDGTCSGCNLTGGGFWAAGQATVTGSTFTENLADCEAGCSNSGGGFQTYGVADVASSTFTGNNVGCDGECSALGGAINGGLVDVFDSTFTENRAGCTGGCENIGGAIAGGAVFTTGSTFTGNLATCNDSCAADGGAIVTGIISFGGGSTSYAPQVASGGGWGGPRAYATASIALGDFGSTTSTFDGNRASADTGNCECAGGAVYVFDSEAVTIDASTFSANYALYGGGALTVNFEGAATNATITNSTVTGNDSGFNGALDLSDTGVTSLLAYNTIVGNTVHTVDPTSTSSGDDLRGAASLESPANLSVDSATLFANIIALPGGGAENCTVWSAATSQGYNWSDDTSCELTDATDKVATPNDPQLNGLGPWGGPTDTMLPLTPLHGGATSPVIDAIPAAACQTGIAAGITTDQRGVDRPQLVGCDIGAVEVTQQDLQVEAAVIQPRFTG